MPGKAQKGHLAFEATFESANLGKVDFVQVHLQHISSLSLDAHFWHFFRTRNMTFTFAQTLATQDTGGKWKKSWKRENVWIPKRETCHGILLLSESNFHFSLHASEKHLSATLHCIFRNKFVGFFILIYHRPTHSISYLYVCILF